MAEAKQPLLKKESAVYTTTLELSFYVCNSLAAFAWLAVFQAENNWTDGEPTSKSQIGTFFVMTVFLTIGVGYTMWYLLYFNAIIQESRKLKREKRGDQQPDVKGQAVTKGLLLFSDASGFILANTWNSGLKALAGVNRSSPWDESLGYAVASTLVWPIVIVFWDKGAPYFVKKTKKGLSEDRVERIQAMGSTWQGSGAWLVGFAWVMSLRNISEAFAKVILPKNVSATLLVNWIVAALVIFGTIFLYVFTGYRQQRTLPPDADPQAARRGCIARALNPISEVVGLPSYGNSAKLKYIQMTLQGCKYAGVLALRYACEDSVSKNAQGTPLPGSLTAYSTGLTFLVIIATVCIEKWFVYKMKQINQEVVTESRKNSVNSVSSRQQRTFTNEGEQLELGSSPSFGFSMPSERAVYEWRMRYPALLKKIVTEDLAYWCAYSWFYFFKYQATWQSNHQWLYAFLTTSVAVVWPTLSKKLSCCRRRAPPLDDLDEFQGFSNAAAVTPDTIAVETESLA